MRFICRLYWDYTRPVYLFPFTSRAAINIDFDLLTNFIHIKYIYHPEICTAYEMLDARCVCVCVESHKFPMLFSRISHTSLFFRKTEWKYSRRRNANANNIQSQRKKKTIFIYSTFLLFIHGMYYAKRARARLWDTHGVRWCAIHNWEKSNEH